MATDEKKQKNLRTRAWTFILYPESAPENWRDILCEMHVPFVVSPLHDQDKNPTGEAKKPHWHVMLSFTTLKSRDQILELIEPLHAPSPQMCHDQKGMVRYFLHLDNPEKHQYSRDQITAYGGVDIDDFFKPSASQRYGIIGEMMQWCGDNDIIEYQDLVEFAMVEHFEDWFPLLCDSASFIMTTYLKSRRHNPDRNIRRQKDGTVLDRYSGEVMVDEDVVKARSEEAKQKAKAAMKKLEDREKELRATFDALWDGLPLD